MHSYLGSQLFGAGLLSICLFCLLRDATAGKGKGGRQGHIIIQNELKGHQVPVYMPFPIPIPMPMGPVPGGGGGGKHFNQQHENDGEGEVKKIYLLQPVPKIQPQPQLKGGGFMGPVQNHIHLSSPMINHAAKMRTRSHQSPAYGQTQQQSFDGDHGLSMNQLQDQHQESHGRKSGGGGGSGHGGSDLKILPIIVIPPIAPMPAIQIPQTQTQTPKLTLSPQFNNYVVAGSERRKSHSSGNGVHSSSAFQDQQSFADYGSGVGASMFRNNYSPRVSKSSGGRGRYGGRSSLGHSDPGQATWSRLRGRADLDSGSDGFDAGASSWRPQGDQFYSGSHQSYQRRDRPAYHSRRFRLHPRDNIRLNSRTIKDIIENQVMFDDEPVSEASNEMRDSVAIDSHQLRLNHNREHPDERHSRSGGSMELDQSSNFRDSNGDQNSNSNSNHQHLPSINHQQQIDAPLDDPIDRDLPSRNDHQSDLSPSYYDREYEPPVEVSPSIGRSNLRPYGHSRRMNVGSGSRFYQPEQQRELEDDEWRFDSIKSISHASPNGTISSSTTPTPELSDNNISNSSATIIPPMEG